MANQSDLFAGLSVAMITPFKNGEIDESGLQALVDYHVEQGTDTLCPVGTTGESPTLS
ncbi:MAG: dihydrodipicolinate synthase family protein, partial [Gimesia chilikensis]